MSQEVEELARRVLGLLGKGDADAVNEFADPDVEWHSFFAELGDGGVYRGHQGTQRFMADITDAWDPVYGEVDESYSAGDVAVLIGRIHYRGRVSGVETHTATGWLFRFRDGRVFYWHAFRNPQEALDVAGISAKAGG
jgi:ketosteroid isomerase-like protein